MFINHRKFLITGYPKWPPAPFFFLLYSHIHTHFAFVSAHTQQHQQSYRSYVLGLDDTSVMFLSTVHEDSLNVQRDSLIIFFLLKLSRNSHNLATRVHMIHNLFLETAHVFLKSMNNSTELRIFALE